MIRYIFFLAYFLLEPNETCGQHNPITNESLLYHYQEIEIEFTRGKVKGDSLPMKEYMYIHDPLFMSIYSMAMRPKNKAIVKYNVSNQILCLDSTAGFIQNFYQNGNLIERNIFKDYGKNLETIIRFSYDSLSRITKNSTYKRVYRPPYKDSSIEYYLDKQIIYDYHNDTCHEKELRFLFGDSIKPVSTLRSRTVYTHTKQLKETIKFNSNNSVEQKTIFDNNGNSIRYNYDKFTSELYNTKITYLNGDRNKMLYRICKYPDSSVMFLNNYIYNKQNNLIEIVSKFKDFDKKDTLTYNYFRETITYDKLNNPIERQIFKNDQLLYFKKTTFNNRGEVEETIYYTNKNELILKYTVFYKE